MSHFKPIERVLNAHHFFIVFSIVMFQDFIICISLIDHDEFLHADRYPRKEGAEFNILDECDHTNPDMLKFG